MAQNIQTLLKCLLQRHSYTVRGQACKTITSGSRSLLGRINSLLLFSSTRISDTVEPFTGTNWRLFVDFTNENPIRDSCVICGYNCTMKSFSCWSDKSAGMCDFFGNLSWAFGCSVSGMPAINSTVTINTIRGLSCVKRYSKPGSKIKL